MNTAGCVKLIEAEDLTRFSKLIVGPNSEWKRVNKFKYKDGIRRYFVLTNSCVIATVDEVDGGLPVVAVRPPMLWELYMIQEARRDDDFLQEDVHDLYDDEYDFVTRFAAKYSEVEQYKFTIGAEDGGWIFFSPKKYTSYDQHLQGDLYDLLPVSIRDDEVCECMFSTNGGVTKEDLIALGFEYYEGDQ